jgi:hypothetical protein
LMDWTCYGIFFLVFFTTRGEHGKRVSLTVRYSGLCSS